MIAAVVAMAAPGCARANPLFGADAGDSTRGGGTAETSDGSAIGGTDDDGGGTAGQGGDTIGVAGSDNDEAGGDDSDGEPDDDGGVTGGRRLDLGGRPDRCLDPEQPAGGGQCPSQCNGGCDDGTCHVDCLEDGDCQGDVVLCPAGWPCAIYCAGEHSCSGNATFIDCGDNDCVVECEGNSSCQQAQVVCGDGACVLECIGVASCQFGSIACGAGPCEAACEDADTPLNVSCGDACDCTDTCARR